MEQAIQVLQQQLYTLVNGLPGTRHMTEVLDEIVRTAASLKELHTVRADMEAAKVALANAERAVGNISNMGTIAGSPGHAIVSAVMANRERIRHDVRNGLPEGIAAMKLLSELATILNSTPAAAPLVRGKENEVPAEAKPTVSRPVIVATDEPQADPEAELPNETVRQALEEHLGNGRRAPRTDGEGLRRQNI